MTNLMDNPFLPLNPSTVYYLHQPVPMANTSRMNIGRVMAELFFTTEWDYAGLEAWVEALGYDYLDWSITEPVQSIRFSFIRAWEGGEESFILEYSGHDEMILTLFNKIQEEVLP